MISAAPWRRPDPDFSRTDARFVFLGDDQLAVITTYDGDFDRAIHAFVDESGPVVDDLRKHKEGTPQLSVRDNAAAFLDYVKNRGLKALGGMYSAYPARSVQDIHELQKQAVYGLCEVNREKIRGARLNSRSVRYLLTEGNVRIRAS